MKEKLAILDFFSQPANLSLGLTVADQMDKVRWQMNNRLWRELHPRLNALIEEHALAWRIDLTEDKNAPDSLVGLHCASLTEQELYLRPMMEQQYLGGEWRVYFGLMWSMAPSPAQLGLAPVNSLKKALQNAGFKSNESFLAWQWTGFYPRRKDFLLRYVHQPEQLLDDMEVVLKTLLINHGGSIAQANEVLKTAPQRGLYASLDQLRDELLD